MEGYANYPKSMITALARLDVSNGEGHGRKISVGYKIFAIVFRRDHVLRDKRHFRSRLLGGRSRQERSGPPYHAFRRRLPTLG